VSIITINESQIQSLIFKFLLVILVHYPYIICFSVKHRSGNPRKIEVHNMFRIKLVSFNVTTTFKPPKIANMPINVIIIVTTHN
jgi:hypothetical protein